jgi:hypothetical protein
VTISDHSVTAGFLGVGELDGLAAAFPAFRFSYRPVGRPGSCWSAERKNGIDPGVHIVITSDLAELRVVLAGQEGAGRAR